MVKKSSLLKKKCRIYRANRFHAFNNKKAFYSLHLHCKSVKHLPFGDDKIIVAGSRWAVPSIAAETRWKTKIKQRSLQRLLVQNAKN